MIEYIPPIYYTRWEDGTWSFSWNFSFGISFFKEHDGYRIYYLETPLGTLRLSRK